jgi:hypothetical protein
MRKMKDLRGTHAAQVRNAIFRTFRLPALTSTNRKKNAKEVLHWKRSKEVQNSYTSFYEDDDMLDYITKLAFPSFADNDSSDDAYFEICIYTTAVCDIILNPNYPDVECSKKPLELRLRRFKVRFKVFSLSVII